MVRGSHSRTRWLAIPVATLAVLVLVVDVGLVAWAHNQATPVGVAEAVRRFRAAEHVELASEKPALMPAAAEPSTSPPLPGSPKGPPAAPSPVAAKAAASPGLPSPGVYSYATTGYEQISVSGSRREFPARSTITVSPKDCGAEYAWQPLQEHRDASVICAAGGQLRLLSFGNTTTFYGFTSSSHFVCDPSASNGEPGAPAGHTWTYTCASNDSTSKTTGALVGYETIPVAGSDVPTMHVRLVSNVTGSNTGTATSDVWYAMDHSAIVKNTGHTEMDSRGSFGTQHYQVEFSLQLESLTPAR